MDIGAQLQALVHNRKAMLGIGAAAGLGLIVLIRRKQTTGSTTTDTGTGDTGSATYQQPGSYPNTYGTDLATALGNMDSQYSQQVQGFGDQLASVQTALASLQTSGAAVTTPTTTTISPTYTPPGATTTSSSSGSSFGGGGTTAPVATSTASVTPSTQTAVTVPATQPSTVAAAVAALLPSGYGWFATGGSTYTADSVARRYGLSVDTLKQLNPSLKITSGSTLIGKNLPVKVRSNAAAWDLTAYRKVNNIT